MSIRSLDTFTDESFSPFKGFTFALFIGGHGAILRIHIVIGMNMRAHKPLDECADVSTPDLLVQRGIDLCVNRDRQLALHRATSPSHTTTRIHVLYEPTASVAARQE